jgi:hypothetical protein
MVVGFTLRRYPIVAPVAHSVAGVGISSSLPLQIVGIIRDYTGSYEVPMMVASLFMLAAGLCSLGATDAGSDAGRSAPAIQKSHK